MAVRRKNKSREKRQENVWQDTDGTVDCIFLRTHHLYDCILLQ